MPKTILLLAATCAVSLVVLQGAAADAPNVTCSGIFSGKANDVTVAPGDFCILDGAKINRDVIVNTDATLAAENTTIGRDLRATKPYIIATGFGGGTPGPVKVGRDLIISGVDPGAAYYDICDTNVRRDLRITGTAVSGEIEVGDVGEACDSANSQPDTIGHDAVVAANKVGTYVDVGDDGVGHDLAVSTNVVPSGYIDVSDNTVGHNATCSYNNPSLSKDGGDDGPNDVGHKNMGCG